MFITEICHLSAYASTTIHCNDYGVTQKSMGSLLSLVPHQVPSLCPPSSTQMFWSSE